MKPSFSQQLSRLTTKAQLQILRILKEQKSVTLFCATGDEDNEWTKDIHCEIPDFPFYEGNCGAKYAAIRLLSLQDDTIVIKGILKTDDYPGEVTVTLPELEVASMASLADYLQQHFV